MSYQGDYAEDYATLDFKFTTRSTGAIPTTLSGTPALSVYKANGTTQTTVGITLTVDFDATTGLNHVRIDLSSDAFYAVGNDYQVVITTGTVGGVSVVGETVGTFSIENRFDEVDVTKLGGDSTSGTNIKNQYDGSTGLTGDTFPATQQQIGQIAVGSAAVSTPADSYVLTTGSEVSGTFADTATVDNVYHEHDDSGGALELYYEYDVGTNGVGVEVSVTGRINGGNDNLDGIYAYNWDGASWDRLGDYDGQNGTVDVVRTYSLLTRNTGTGSNVGTVRIRFFAASGLSSATLNIDQIIVSFSSVASESQILDSGVAQAGTSNSITLATTAPSLDSYLTHALVLIKQGTGAGQEALISEYVGSTRVATTVPEWVTTPDSTSVYEVIPGIAHAQTMNGGYLNASVWVDTVNGESGTELYVIGTSTRPVDNLSDAFTIASALNLTRFQIEPGSAVTLPADSTNRTFNGEKFNVALNLADIEGSTFNGANSITGVATGGLLAPIFFLCGIGDVTLPPCTGFQCGFFGTFTIGSAGDFTFGGSSDVFNLPFVIDYGAALNSSEFFLQSWGGGNVEIQNAGAGTGTYSLDINGAGSLTINANCSDDTNITVRGNFEITNNSAITTINQEANYNATNEKANVSSASIFTGMTNLAQWLGLMSGKQAGDATAITEIRSTGAGSGTFDETADSLEAIRDRGDAAWVTGGGASLSEILNIQPLIPYEIDVADTSSWRIGFMLTNALDDLPSAAEITPGTISIDRKAIGGTSWSSVVSDSACSESAGLIYFDEVFDSGSGYAEGDSLRFTLKSQKITVSGNDYEITDSVGRIFYTGIRQTMRGTDGANTTTPPTASVIADAVLDEPIPEPSGIFTWPGSIRTILGWMGALGRNKSTVTATTITVRNDADNADLATYPHSDDGTTYTKNEGS